MKPELSSFLLLMVPLWIWGQSVSNNSYALKVYSNFLVEDQETETFDVIKGQMIEHTQTSRTVRLGRFSPALSIYHRNGHFSEIEISFLTVEKENRVRIAGLSAPFDGATRSFSLGLRYAFNANLLFGQQAAVQPHLGLAVLPFVKTFEKAPERNTLYTVTETDLGVLGQVIPRLIFQLSDYLLIDLNAPITVMDVRSRSLRLQKDGAYSYARKESLSAFRWLPPLVHVRLGLGVMF